MSAPETPEVNPVQIVFLTYQLRQLEIHRNNEKNARNKEAMTLRIRKMKEELDPLLEMFAEQEKKKREKPEMVVDRSLGDKDLGPADVVKAIHAYAQQKITQQEVVNYLTSGHPISIAGEYDKVAYVIHFQRTESL